MQIAAERDLKRERNITSITWEMPAAIKERKSTQNHNPHQHMTMKGTVAPWDGIQRSASTHTLIRSTVRYMSTSTWIWGNLDNYTGYASRSWEHQAHPNCSYSVRACRRSELVPISRIWKQKVFRLCEQLNITDLQLCVRTEPVNRTRHFSLQSAQAKL